MCHPEIRNRGKKGRKGQSKGCNKKSKGTKRKHHAMGFGAPSVLVSLGSRIPKQVPKNLVQILHPNGPICADDLVPRIPKKELPRLSMHRCSWLRPFEAAPAGRPSRWNRCGVRRVESRRKTKTWPGCNEFMEETWVMVYVFLLCLLGGKGGFMGTWDGRWSACDRSDASRSHMMTSGSK